MTCAHEGPHSTMVLELSCSPGVWAHAWTLFRSLYTQFGNPNTNLGPLAKVFFNGIFANPPPLRCSTLLKFYCSWNSRQMTRPIFPKLACNLMVRTDCPDSLFYLLRSQLGPCQTQSKRNFLAFPHTHFILYMFTPIWWSIFKPNGWANSPEFGLKLATRIDYLDSHRLWPIFLFFNHSATKPLETLCIQLGHFNKAIMTCMAEYGVFLVEN